MAIEVKIVDEAALRQIQPDCLAAYLQVRGWQQAACVADNLAQQWLLQVTPEEEFEILAPLKTSLGDYVARIYDALYTLSVVEGRSQLEIYTDLTASFKHQVAS